MTRAEQTQSVAVNTDVFFNWTGTHNLWLMPDKAAYDTCDFSKAKELDVNEYIYTPLETGVIYLACQVAGHCAFAAQKLTLSVTPPLGSHVMLVCNELGMLLDYVVS